MHIDLLSEHGLLLKNFFYDNAEPMWIYERSTLKYLVVNKAALQKYGYSEIEFMTMTIADIRPAEDLPALKATIAQECLGFKNAGMWRHITKSGEILFVEITSHITKIDDKEAVMVCARDLTKQLELEEKNSELLQSEKCQREQLEQSLRLLAIASRSGRLGGWRVDLTTMQTQWSEQTAAIHGFSQPQCISAEQAINFYAPAYRQLVKERFNRCAQYGTGFDEICQLIDLHGRDIWVRSIGEAEYDEKGQIVAVQGAFQDVDELIRTKDQLAAVQQNLYDTLEQISDAFFLLDDDWRFVFVNYKAEQLLRQPKTNLLGKNIWLCFPEAVGSTFQLQYQRAVIDKNTVQFEEYFAPLENHFGVTAYPTDNGLAVYFRDISQQKQQAEQLARSASLQQQAQQLDSLAKLTGGIAHDFNNLLTVIVSNSELLTETLQHTETLKSARLCLQAALKASSLTRHLLAFGRRQVLKPETLSLIDLLDYSMPLLDHALGNSVTLSRQMITQDATVKLDKEQFVLALLNLVINAKEAMPEGGNINITAQLASVDTITQHQLPQKQYIQLKLSDNGPGIPENTQQNIFEPFFTTKPVGAGFGLGLSFVYGFMQQSGGDVFVDKQYKDGCCICLLLPLATEHVDSNQSEMNSPPQQLLLVEDDELLLQHLSALLTRAGYIVTPSLSADEASKLIKLNHYDYLFADIVTPGMLSGHSLAKEAIVLQPKLKILLTSGYNDIKLDNEENKNFQFIAKPYNTEVLLSALKTL